MASYAAVIKLPLGNLGALQNGDVRLFICVFVSLFACFLLMQLWVRFYPNAGWSSASGGFTYRLRYTCLSEYGNITTFLGSHEQNTHRVDINNNTSNKRSK